MRKYKILVCGDRDWEDSKFIRAVIVDRVLYAKSRFVVDLPIAIIHGGAKGADTLAGRNAKDLGYEVFRYKAKWEKYGKSAGPIRNSLMLKKHPNIDLGIAFHNDIRKSKGTLDMIEKLNNAGIPVEIYSNRRTIESEKGRSKTKRK